MKFSNNSRMIFEIYLHLVKHHIFNNLIPIKIYDIYKYKYKYINIYGF